MSIISNPTDVASYRNRGTMAFLSKSLNQLYLNNNSQGGSGTGVLEQQNNLSSTSVETHNQGDSEQVIVEKSNGSQSTRPKNRRVSRKESTPNRNQPDAVNSASEITNTSLSTATSSAVATTSQSDSRTATKNESETSDSFSTDQQDSPQRESPETSVLEESSRTNEDRDSVWEREIEILMGPLGLV
ncbi:uncharacterized protein LOC142348565 [Convolutriloba macropyga]|uniref:uncharacterized protein LOC142348565 n=1 Tax=Convolutriloba macropyga TaxID=536237 RepID=UPI003F525D4D